MLVLTDEIRGQGLQAAPGLCDSRVPPQTITRTRATCSLRQQTVDLARLRDDLFPFELLPTAQWPASGRTTFQGQTSSGLCDPVQEDAESKKHARQSACSSDDS